MFLCSYIEYFWHELRRLGTYLFFITLIVHTFSQVVIVGQFFINQDFIAAELCENKDAPELECNGKCYLKKELKKDEERRLRVQWHEQRVFDDKYN